MQLFKKTVLFSYRIHNMFTLTLRWVYFFDIFAVYTEYNEMRH